MPQQSRLQRDRWFPWLNLVVAALWVVVAHQQAEQIRESNSARIVGSLLVGGMGSAKPLSPSENPSTAPSMSGVFPSFSMLTSGSQPAHREAGNRVKSPLASLQASGRTVEAVVYAWEYAMYSAATLLVATTVVSWWSGRTRMAHLAVAAIMMLVTVATLVGMQIIEHPSAGAMPPLPLNRHLLVAAFLSAYAWILVAMFAKPIRLTKTASPIQ